jgi:type IV protein arginine methyltransferase
VDNGGNTAGDIALSLNDEESYRIIRDAGIRSGVYVVCCSSAGATGFLTDHLLFYPGLVELILQLLASHGAEADGLVLKEVDDTALSSTDKFLSSRLRFTVDTHGQEICLLQSGDTEIGVMMGWEREISAFRSATQSRDACSRAVVFFSARDGTQDVRRAP